MSANAQKRKSCARKIAHLTRKEAWKHVQRLRELGHGVRYYPCSKERDDIGKRDHFHVGHRSRRHHVVFAKHRKHGRRLHGRQNSFTRVAA